MATNDAPRLSLDMTRNLPTALAFSTLLAAGCLPDAPSPPPAVSRPDDRGSSAPAPRPRAELSWETDRDQRFAEFVRDRSAGMVKAVAVAIEKKGQLRVEIDKSVAPDDTLDLTKSLMAGARKDFPDRPITLSLYDPKGEPILKARYKPGQGVNYQIAHDTARREEETASPAAAAPSADPMTRSGVTEADRKFATWAEEHGKAYLRYVEADLEKHGRLWFGVTREVKPADVPELTKSLLEGARKEFPKGELVAKVFDPEGEPIGKAHLGTNGKITWER